MSDTPLSFEELTGSASAEQWNSETLDSEYAAISSKAQEMEDLKDELSKLEEQVKATKERLRLVEEQELPEAMQAANLAEIKLLNGSKISVSPFYKGYISEKNREQAHEWLKQHGHEGIIKNEITVRFGKDEFEKAEHAKSTLLQQGLTPAVKQGVHSQTLNAFVKEQLTSGKDLPADLFGVYVGSRAKIK